MLATTSPRTTRVPTSSTEVRRPGTSADRRASSRLITVPGTMVTGAMLRTSAMATRTSAGPPVWAWMAAGSRHRANSTIRRVGSHRRKRAEFMS